MSALTFRKMTAAEIQWLCEMYPISSHEDPDQCLADAIEAGNCPRCGGRGGRWVEDISGCASHLKAMPDEKWETCAICQPDPMTAEDAADQRRAERKERIDDDNV